MTQVGPCDIRLVSLVLQMSSLDYFVASAYKTLRERGIQMEEAIIAFGEEEKNRLTKTMSTKMKEEMATYLWTSWVALFKL